MLAGLSVRVQWATATLYATFSISLLLLALPLASSAHILLFHFTHAIMYLSLAALQGAMVSSFSG